MPDYNTHEIREMELLQVAKSNFQHALDDNCTDLDCELHHPGVIEDEWSRLNASAYFIAGAATAVSEMAQGFRENILQAREDRDWFLDPGGKQAGEL